MFFLHKIQDLILSLEVWVLVLGLVFFFFSVTSEEVMHIQGMQNWDLVIMTELL